MNRERDRILIPEDMHHVTLRRLVVPHSERAVCTDAGRDGAVCGHIQRDDGLLVATPGVQVEGRGVGQETVTVAGGRGGDIVSGCFEKYTERYYTSLGYDSQTQTNKR